MHLVRLLLFFLLGIRAGADILFNEARVEGVGSPGAVLNAVVILLFLVSLAVKYRERTKLFLLVWVPYLAIAALSLFHTPDFVGGVRLFLTTLTFPSIFGLMFVCIRTDDHLASLLKVIIYSSVIPAAVAVYQLITDGLESRPPSTLNHPNIFAFYIIAVLIAGLYWAQISRGTFGVGKKLMWYGYASFLLVLLVFTQTRNAWFAAVLVAAFYAVGIDRRLLLAVPLVPMVLLVPTVADRIADVEVAQNVTFEEVRNGSVILNSYVWRKMLWESALAHSSDSRVLGMGLNSFRNNSVQFFPLVNDTSSTDAHSGYVQTIYELGIVGLLAYIWCYVSVALIAFKRRSGMERETWLILALVSVNLVINYADNIPYYLPYNWYIWAIFGADLARRCAISRAKRKVRAGNMASFTALSTAHQA